MKNKHTRQQKMEAFGRLLDVQHRLRKECPWDKKQTYESLRPNTIEEVFELCDALMKHDAPNICKELGDVLEHVMFYAMIGNEDGDFDVADVCNQLADKLMFRHPFINWKQEKGDWGIDNQPFTVSGNQLTIEAPFVKWTKKDVVREGLRLHVPYELTWSCYEGGDKPCGKCGTCLDRAAAFAANGVKDPALED